MKLEKPRTRSFTQSAESKPHLAATIPPSLLISEWIGRLKGGSSFYINHEIANRKVLDWQKGYGVVSFGTKDLQWVIEYVKNQKEHHAQGTTNERCDDEDQKAVETASEFLLPARNQP
ncbi:MAG: transposase [Pyrinomonadaceae bacterium]